MHFRRPGVRLSMSSPVYVRLKVVRAKYQAPRDATSAETEQAGYIVQGQDCTLR